MKNIRLMMNKNNEKEDKNKANNTYYIVNSIKKLEKKIDTILKKLGIY